jgi:hypothetical protein
MVAASLLSAGQVRAQDPAAQPALIPDLKQADHTEVHQAAEAGYESCCKWYNHIGLFGDFLYLQARGLDVPFARLTNGCGPDAVPTGGPGIARPDYAPGFRIGGAFGIDECSCIMAAFTRFESRTNASLAAGPNDTITGLVTLPNNSCSASIGANSVAATANFGVDFTFVDVDYKRLLASRCGFTLDWYVGVRYANLDEDLVVNIPALQSTLVKTNVEFDGVGPRLGLEGEKVSCCGLLLYGRAGADFLAGTFRAHFNQTNSFIGTVGNADFDDDRIVTILELELGVGWQSKNGCVRVQAGYLINGWFNTLNVGDFTHAVGTSNFTTNCCNLSNDLSFDGFVGRIAFHF